MAARFTFIFRPADDPSVDPDHELHTEFGYARIAIQDCRSYGGDYALNEYGGKGDRFWSRQHATYTRLADAKEAAIELYKARFKKPRANDNHVPAIVETAPGSAYLDGRKSR